MSRVDVVIPNYQYGSYLLQCVDSVLRQDVAGLRVLIIDNASTDHSVEVAQRITAQDARVQLIAHEKNMGHVGSINEGIDWASSEYFMMLCSDDVLAGGALGRALDVMDKNREIVICQGDYRHFCGNEEADFDQIQSEAAARIYSGAQYIQELCRSPMASKGNFFVTRTEAQKKAGHYRPSLPHTCDLEMVLRLCGLGQFAELPTIQGFRRLHGHNIANECRDSRLLRLSAVANAFESFFAHDGRLLRDAPELETEVRKRLASQGYWAGAAHLIAGQRQAARELFDFAFAQSHRCRYLPPVGALLSTRLPNRISLALGDTRTGIASKHLARADREGAAAASLR